MREHEAAQHVSHRNAVSVRLMPVRVRPEASGADTVGKLVDALRRWKLLAGGIFVVATALGGVFAMLMPTEYAAEMRLLITRSRVDAPVSASEQPGSAPVPADLSEPEVNSELELLKSGDLIQNAARQAGLLPVNGQPDTPVTTANRLKNIQKNLEVMLVKRTNIISVKYVARDRFEAQKFVNALGDLYLEKHSAVHRNRETSAFFDEKARDYKEQLDEAQRELAAFEQGSGVALLEAQREQNLKRRAELEASLDQTTSELRQADDRAKVLRAQLKSLPATVNLQNRMARNEPLIEKLKVMQVELEQKRTELLTKYDPSYRLVQEVEQQLRSTKAALDQELAPGVVDTVSAINPLRQSVESELLKTEALTAGLGAQQRSILAVLRGMISDGASLTRSTPRYEDLKRKAKIAEENYLLYRRKQEESRIAEEMDQQRILNVSVLQPASVPVLPEERHRSFFLGMFTFAGTLLAMLAALLMDQTDRPVETATQAASAAGVPVIASFTRGVRKCS